MLVVITDMIEQGHQTAASLVGQAIKRNPTLRLGLAAGNTSIGLYQSLVALHQSTHLDSFVHQHMKLLAAVSHSDDKHFSPLCSPVLRRLGHSRRIAPAHLILVSYKSRGKPLNQCHHSTGQGHDRCFS